MFSVRQGIAVSIFVRHDIVIPEFNLFAGPVPDAFYCVDAETSADWTTQYYPSLSGRFAHSDPCYREQLPDSCKESAESVQPAVLRYTRHEVVARPDR